MEGERWERRGGGQAGWECGGMAGRGGIVYFDLEEVLWWAVDFFEALLAGVGHCLHFGGGGVVAGWGFGEMLRDR